MADNFDLASVLQSATEASSASASFGQLALQTGNLLAGIQADKSREAKEVAGAASIIDEQANLAKMQQEQTRIRIANRMGINANDSSWMIGKLGDEVKSNYAIMQEANKVIGEKQSINFLENPLGYLHGQLTVNSDIARYNAASSARETAFNTAGQLEKVGQDSFLTNNALVETVNQSTINASKIVAGHKYLVEANDAASQGLRDNLAGVQIAANQSVQQAQLKFESNGAIMREKAYQVSLEHLQLDQARFNLQKAAAQDKLDEDSLVKKFIVQGFFNQTGGKLPDDGSVKDFITMYKAKDPRMQRMFQSGMDSYRVSPGGAPVPII